MIEERIAWEFESAPAREQIQRRGRAALSFEQAILDRRPASDEIVDDILRAIEDLGTCRQFRMRMIQTPTGSLPVPDSGPIPFNEIRRYWLDRGLDPVAVQIMTTATLAGDRAYLAQRSKPS